MKSKNKPEIGMAIGIAIGCAIGFALDNMGVWITIGIAFRAGLGKYLSQKKEKK